MSRRPCLEIPGKNGNGSEGLTEDLDKLSLGSGFSRAPRPGLGRGRGARTHSPLFVQWQSEKVEQARKEEAEAELTSGLKMFIPRQVAFPVRSGRQEVPVEEPDKNKTQENEGKQAKKLEPVIEVEQAGLEKKTGVKIGNGKKEVKALEEKGAAGNDIWDETKKENLEGMNPKLASALPPESSMMKSSQEKEKDCERYEINAALPPNGDDWDMPLATVHVTKQPITQNASDVCVHDFCNMPCVDTDCNRNKEVKLLICIKCKQIRLHCKCGVKVAA